MSEDRSSRPIASALRLLAFLAGFALLTPAASTLALPDAPPWMTPLARAQEIEEAGDDAGAYAAFSSLLKQPGLSDRDVADAEIGAARSLRRWAGSERSRRSRGVEHPANETAPPPDDSLARLEASARRWAGTPQEPRVLLALVRLEAVPESEETDAQRQRRVARLEKALEIYDRLAARPATPADAVDAELGAVDCLRELGRNAEASERLEKAAGRPWGPGERARLSIALAARQCLSLSFDDDTAPTKEKIADAERALSLYRSIVSDLPGSAEAAQAFYSEATCLRQAGRRDEALQVYEEVARKQPGTLRAARALLMLGMYHDSRDERQLAAPYFRRIVAEYPPTWMLVRGASTHLEQLDHYTFSPFYDRLMHGIERRFVQGILRFDGSDPSAVFLSLGLTIFVSRLGGLLLVLGVLAIFARLAPATGSAPLLRRAWTPRRVVLVALVLWIGSTVIQIAAGLFMSSIPFWLFMKSDTIAHGFLAVGMIGIILWREPLRSVLGVPLRGVLRTAIVVAAVGVLAVVGTFLFWVVRWWLVESGQVASVRRTHWSGLSPGQPWWHVVPHYLVWALAEECFFRGAVYQAFKGRTATWAAALLSSLLFAQYHIYPLSATLWAMAFGVLAAWLVERTRSLGPATLVHALLNLFIYRS